MGTQLCERKLIRHACAPKCRVWKNRSCGLGKERLAAAAARLYRITVAPLTGPHAQIVRCEIVRGPQWHARLDPAPARGAGRRPVAALCARIRPDGDCCAGDGARRLSDRRRDQPGLCPQESARYHRAGFRAAVVLFLVKALATYGQSSCSRVSATTSSPTISAGCSRSCSNITSASSPTGTARIHGAAQYRRRRRQPGAQSR